MAVVSMKQLLEAGVHFGHQTRRWNPKMAKYIFTCLLYTSTAGGGNAPASVSKLVCCGGAGE